jgi:hypothetical protein
MVLLPRLPSLQVLKLWSQEVENLESGWAGTNGKGIAAKHPNFS